MAPASRIPSIRKPPQGPSTGRTQSALKLLSQVVSLSWKTKWMVQASSCTRCWASHTSRPAFQVIYAQDGRKAASDAYLRGCLDEQDRPLFRVVDEQWARKESATQLKNLPLIVGFITGAVAVIVALVTALLNVITFQSRLDEFALYLAVGHPRSRLVRKLAVETTATAIAGWLAGLGLGLATVAVYDRLFLDPKAIEMQVVDAQPFLFSLMVPVLSAVVSAAVLALRLHRMDPVSVIQRRGA